MHQLDSIRGVRAYCLGPSISNGDGTTGCATYINNTIVELVVLFRAGQCVSSQRLTRDRHFESRTHLLSVFYLLLKASVEVSKNLILNVHRHPKNPVEKLLDGCTFRSGNPSANTSVLGLVQVGTPLLVQRGVCMESKRLSHILWRDLVLGSRGVQ